MGKKKFPDPAAPTGRLGVVAKIIFSYYLILAGVVLLTVKTTAPADWGQIHPGIDWYGMVQIVFFGLPVFLAVLYGAVFRPFWAGFRNILVPVLLIHGLYSVAVYGWRIVYLETVREQNAQARLANINVYQVRHRLVDHSKDGQIDLVEFGAKVDTDDFSPGEYYVSARISQRGQEFPDSQIGRFRFQILAKDQKPLPLRFKVNPQVFEPYYGSGSFELNLAFSKVVPVEKNGRVLLAFSRWAPFIRFTSWEGSDPQIENTEIELDYLRGVDSFSIMSLKIEPRQVTLTGPITDKPVDEDKNGKYDYLILSIPFKSEYDGPLYVQTILDGAEAPLTYEGQALIGENTFEIMVDANYVRSSGQDGPLLFQDLRLFNRNPQCQEGECPRLIKPYFTVYLDDYLSQSYRLEQFEP